MQLSNILGKLNGKIDLQGNEDFNVQDVTNNSKMVVKDSIFVAIEGSKINAVACIINAFKMGAKLCVIPTIYKNQSIEFYLEKTNNEDVSTQLFALCNNNSSPILYVDDPREFLAKSLITLNSKIIPENLITVTGTNGKSSVSFFVAEILRLLNIKNMLIGTLGIFIDGNKTTDSLTTPSIINLIDAFKEAKKNNIEYVIMESSSHGIEQKRIAGLPFKCAGFTNLTHDHLDYHSNMEQYFNAKKALFVNENVQNSLINVDDEYGEQLFALLKSLGLTVYDYGYKADFLKIIKIEKHGTSQTLIVEHNSNTYPITINFIAEFQAYNILCALGLLINCGINIEQIIPIIPEVQPLTGRLNLIKSKIGKIFIDFAHTPNALQSVLEALKKENPKKLKVLFGCGGNRDPLKRPVMGEIATKYADVIYVTDDNSRFEDSSQIREEIVQGITSSNYKGEYFNIATRELAVKQALSELQMDEILIWAGQGHENGQIVLDKVLPYNETEVVMNTLKLLNMEIEG